MINVWWKVFLLLAMSAVFAGGSRANAEGVRLLNVDSATSSELSDEAQGIFVTGSTRHIFSPEDGYDGLRLVTPPGGMLRGQVVDRPLGQFSTLTWAWRMQPTQEPEAADLPIRLIVGYVDAPMPQKTEERRIDALPLHDRALLIVWGTDPNDEGRRERVGQYGRYFVNAGKVSEGWWEQVVDLRSLHQILWPDVSIQNVRIAFVAAAVRDSTRFSQADIMRIELGSPPQMRSGMSDSGR